MHTEFMQTSLAEVKFIEFLLKP